MGKVWPEGMGERNLLFAYPHAPHTVLVLGSFTGGFFFILFPLTPQHPPRLPAPPPSPRRGGGRFYYLHTRTPHTAHLGSWFWLSVGGKKKAGREEKGGWDGRKRFYIICTPARRHLGSWFLFSVGGKKKGGEGMKLRAGRDCGLMRFENDEFTKARMFMYNSRGREQKGRKRALMVIRVSFLKPPPIPSRPRGVRFEVSPST